MRKLPLGYRVAKRLFDIVLGGLGLLLSAPLILAAALAIWLESPGNPFFLQTRIGVGGKPFTIFKLRGMYRDARERYPELYDYSRFGDLSFYFHHERDPRITKAGSFFRRTSIDELPNLLNVVLGNMTLVGPRPEIPDVLALYGHYAMPYVSVKPGVTCLSKTSGRDRLTKEESIKMDLDYVDSMSLGLDLRILTRTFCNVALRRDVFANNGHHREPGPQPPEAKVAVSVERD